MANSFRSFLRPGSILLTAVALAGGVIHSAGPAVAHEVRKAVLPLGDGHIAFRPVAGSIFACDAQFAPGGAFRDGPWISGGQWFPDGKVQVEGDVGWPGAQIRIAREGDFRMIIANGLPVNQKTGAYPVAQGSAAYAYDRNPNAIAPQVIRLQLPARPVEAAQPSCVGMGMIGVTLTGVGIFNGLDAGGRDAAAHEIQDHCNGHPERRGQYHYHSWSPCIPDESGAAGQHSDLAGYMLDGFGIYGPMGEGGKRLENSDLDACHGHTHSINWDGQEVVMYHYHFTDEYPYSIGCFKGKPVAVPHMGEGAQGQRPPPPRMPPHMPPPPPPGR